MCILIVREPSYDVIIFEINLSNQGVFFYDQKSQDKNLNILRSERAIKIKQKPFFMIFKGLSTNWIKQFFLEGKSPP